MSEIWSSDELMVNMGSFSDSGSEEDSLLSTWLSHAVQLDGNSTGIEYNISGKYEGCGKLVEVYGTIGEYSDVFLSCYVEPSPNYECSDGVSLSMEIRRTSPQYNSVGSKAYISSSLQDPKAISYYWPEDCMNSCPSDQSRAISVPPSSLSAEQEDSHVRVHSNANEGFSVVFDGYPIATSGAFHSCEDLMKNMLSAPSMPELSFSSLPVSNIVMQNLIEGEKAVAWNLQKVDAVLESKSGGNDHIGYVNQFLWENEREEIYQMPINDAVVEEQLPPPKRHCSASERFMADRAKENAVPSVEDGINYAPTSSSSLMPVSMEPTLSSKVGTAFNTDGKPRARRGHASNPQSLYARQRREKINERLKVLQNLVPNGTKVDISTMLEDAIQYVKFLQLQIKILSSDGHWMQAPIAFHAVDATVHEPSTCQ